MRDVAIHKAQHAYRTLRVPLIIEDSGFGIDGLRGYPGPMIKYLLAAAGAEGVANLASLTTDRVGRFTSVLVYIDGHGVVPRVLRQRQTRDDRSAAGARCHSAAMSTR